MERSGFFGVVEVRRFDGHLMACEGKSRKDVSVKIGEDSLVALTGRAGA
jgi:hypothetical protein